MEERKKGSVALAQPITKITIRTTFDLPNTTKTNSHAWYSSNMHSSFAHSFVCATYANGTSPASASIATAAAAHTRAYPFRRCRSAVPSMPRALYEYVRHQLASCDIARGDNVGGDQYMLYQQQKSLRATHTHCLHLHGILYTLLIHIEFITFHQHTRTNDDVLHTRLHHDN